VATLQALQRAGDHQQAIAGARAARRDDPDNRDLALIEAISLRHLGAIEQSLAVIDAALVAHPRFSLLHQQRGLCHVARKDAPKAIEAFLTAVNLNPALPMAWRMLEGVYRLAGDTANATLAAGHVATLAALPDEVVAATSLFSDGDRDAAERMIRAFLLARGDHPEAMRLLARIGMAHEAWDDAEVLLAGVLAITPEYRAARFDYARTLLARHKHVQAQAEIARLREDEPANAELRSMAATAMVGLGRTAEAIAIYRALLPDVAADPVAAADVQLWLGHALKTEGDLPGAIIAYRAAANIRVTFGDAWWSLANLKTYRFADTEIATIEGPPPIRRTIRSTASI
jgi:tetratricopeptide (TPR) repeat protein